MAPVVIVTAVFAAVVLVNTAVWAADDPAMIVSPPEGTLDKATSDDVEALTRGPMHEAFAEMYVSDATPGLSVDKAPPEPIDELPPDMKPEGEDVVWISGYWAWDEDRKDYLWISGVWRKVPPGRTWVPGYWHEVGGKWQWVSGFWGNSRDLEVEYLPTPPKSLESGPTSPSPGDNHTYVPGSWVHVGNGYQWRAGYWLAARPDWVWIPARYVLTPCGCIYRSGYWDYVPHHRGTLFAPVCFHRPVYARVGYHFTPHCVIEIGASFFVHLFARPTYCHYYFGDYYADRYLGYQIYPWVSLWSAHHHYDPMFAYYSHCSRYDTMLTRVRGWHHHFHTHQAHRPATSFSIQLHSSTSLGSSISLMASLGSGYSDHVRRHDHGTHFVHVPVDARASYRAYSKKMHGFAATRASFESHHPHSNDGGPRPASGGHSPSNRLRMPELDHSYAKAMRSEPRPPDRSIALPSARHESHHGRSIERHATTSGFRARESDTHSEMAARTRQSHSQADTFREQSDTARHSFRGNFPRGPEASTMRTRDSMAEVLQQQRDRIARQNANRPEASRPESATHRAPTARSNSSASSAGRDRITEFFRSRATSANRSTTSGATTTGQARRSHSPATASRPAIPSSPRHNSSGTSGRSSGTSGRAQSGASSRPTLPLARPSGSNAFHGSSSRASRSSGASHSSGASRSSGAPRSSAAPPRSSAPRGGSGRGGHSPGRH